MAKRRKRRSQAAFDQRLMKDIRAKRVAFLRELSEMVSNAVGVRIRCSIVGGDVVVPKPTKPKRKKPTRRVAHVAGYQEEPLAQHLEPDQQPELPDDGVGF
jgi:hypothetical protein